MVSAYSHPFLGECVESSGVSSFGASKTGQFIASLRLKELRGKFNPSIASSEADDTEGERKGNL